MKSDELIERALIIGFSALWANELSGPFEPRDQDFLCGQQLYAEMVKEVGK